MRGVVNHVLRQKATLLRQQGYSYPMIENRFSIPRATLSGWFKNLVLPPKAIQRILNRKQNNLAHIRKKAVKVLKKKRDDIATELQLKVNSEFLNYCPDIKTYELLLAALYIGEGFKKTTVIGLGNSSPEVILFFLRLLHKVHTIDFQKIKCYLFLRMDQQEESEIRFWSRYLKIPPDQFGKSQFDKRTINSQTWDDYHGVCAVYYYDAALAKRLAIVQKKLLQIISGV